MAKNKKGKTQNKSVKQIKTSVKPVKDEEVKVNELATDELEVKAEKVEAEKVSSKPTKLKKEHGKKGKVVEVKAKDVKKETKPKKPNKLAKNLKDTGAELKKVTWPKFKEVVKQTGIVLVVVIVFALVLFGLDRLCFWLTSFLY